jgi:hypothetical protein
MDKRIKGLFAACCSLGVALLVTGPSWSAVEKEAALPAAATLEELDEIVINGKRIEQRILESEQRLYERYNTLNANNDFDVNCSTRWSDHQLTSYGTAHFKSGCVPRFLANAMARASSSAGSGSSSRSWTNTPVVGGYALMRSHTVWGPTGGGSSSLHSPASIISLPSLQLLWLDRRAAFKANLNKVIRGDPQLQALAGELNSLVQENNDALKVAEAARKAQTKLRRAEQKCAAPISPRAVAKACKTG